MMQDAKTSLTNKNKRGS